MRVPTIALVLFANGLLAHADLFADAATEAQAKAAQPETDTPLRTGKVRVLDPEGQPLANATVRPCGFLTPAGPAKKMDPRPVKTDADGMATVQFPQRVFWTAWQPLIQIDLVVTHPGYCHQKLSWTIQDRQDGLVHEAKLRRGTRIRLGGFEAEQDQPLKNCHVLMENRDTDEPDFVELADGWLQSDPLPEYRRWFRLVHKSDDGSLRFSSHQAWSSDNGPDQVIRVDLRPGVRLSGRLSDNVARPITNGRVVVWCAPPHRAGAQKPAEATESSWWMDTTDIADDGTFAFQSLPNGYIAQCYAVANDSISIGASTQVIEQCSQWLDVPIVPCPLAGQVVRLTGKSTDLILQMKPAATANVRVVDAQGRPIQGIDAHSCPAQSVIGLNTRNCAIFCFRRSTLEELLGTYDPTIRTNNPYAQVTDADGRATIHNLPNGLHRIFASKGSLTNGDGQECQFLSGQTNDVTVTLQGKPSPAP